MKNPLLTRVCNNTADNFATETGIRLRQLAGGAIRFALRCATKRKVILESYPKLNKGEAYVFASSHSFDEDVICGLGNVDRNAWLLNGTTHQITYNPQMYAAWLNGMIYVNRNSEESRKESVKKMIRILKSKSSIFMFPEGGWNNTENLLIQPLFAGPWILAKETGCKVVPFVSFNEHNSKTIYIRVAEPLNLADMEKEEALTVLRDTMATLVYEIMEKHCEITHRADLEKTDSFMQFLEERRIEYLRVKWKADVWDEELTFYHDKRKPLPQKVREYIDHVKLNSENAGIIAPILVQRENDKKRDFTSYMHLNWEKAI